jgi:hypothetical protein
LRDEDRHELDVGAVEAPASRTVECCPQRRRGYFLALPTADRGNAPGCRAQTRAEGFGKDSKPVDASRTAHDARRRT